VDDRTACVYAAAEIRRIREVSHETNADRPAARGRSRREHDETGGSPLGMGLGPRRLRHRRADRRGAVATGLFLLLSGLLWLWLRLPRYGYGYGYRAYGYGYPAYAYGYGYPSYGYGGYYRPYYRAYAYRAYARYPVARRVAIHRARWR